MMLAVNGDPGNRRTFARQSAEQGQRPADPAEGLKAPMGQQPVIPQATPTPPVSQAKTTTSSTPFHVKKNTGPKRQRESARSRRPDPVESVRPAAGFPGRRRPDAALWQTGRGDTVAESVRSRTGGDGLTY